MCDAAEVISVVKDIALTLGAIVGPILVYVGFYQWINVLRGTDRYTLGKKLISALLDFKYAIENARNPFLVYAKDADASGDAFSKAMSDRLKLIYDTRNALVLLTREYEVLQGLGTFIDMRPLLGIFAEVVVAIEMNLEIRHKGEVQGITSEADKQWRREHTDLMYDRGPTDKVNVKLIPEVKKIEQFIREKFKI